MIGNLIAGVVFFLAIGGALEFGRHVGRKQATAEWLEKLRREGFVVEVAGQDYLTDRGPEAQARRGWQPVVLPGKKRGGPS